MTPTPGDEFAFIDWIRSQNPETWERIPIGIGDDACGVDVSGQKLVLVTADMLLEGTHFDLSVSSPYDVGRKAVNVNLSDVAAMGVPAVCMVVTVGLTRGRGVEFARELYRGMKEMSDRYGVPISGGDVTSWTGGLAISITALGLDEGLTPVRRSGARVGDVICVTGELGGSLLGRHMDFVPRLVEGVALNRHYLLHAMIDISDGLAKDLGHILEESKVGAELDVESVPVSADALRMSRQTGKPPIQHALGDGEDFELLFTLPPEEADRLLAAPPFPTRLTRIGRIVKGAGLVLLDAQGQPLKLDVDGYEHRL